jgi:hypothetical protein
MEHRANETAAAFGANIERMRFLQSSKQSFRSSKIEVSSLSFLRFLNSQKVNFADFAFFDFRIAAPWPGGTRWSKGQKKVFVRARRLCASCLDRPAHPT